MKRFTGQTKHNDVSGLANVAADGDLSALADLINKSLKQVSDDLQPVKEVQQTDSCQVPDQYIISPTTVLNKLQRICAYKAPGP